MEEGFVLASLVLALLIAFGGMVRIYYLSIPTDGKRSVIDLLFMSTLAAVVLVPAIIVVFAMAGIGWGIAIVLIGTGLSIKFYTRAIHSHGKNKMLRGILLIKMAAVPLFVGLGAVGAFMTDGFFLRNKFSKDLWAEHEERRYKMADDIIKSRMLIGKNRQQVAEMLGEYGDGHDTSARWIYYMGADPGFSMLPDLLELEIFFNADTVERVVQTRED